MNNKIFLNEDQNIFFIDNGYILINNFFSEIEINKLYNIYITNLPKIEHSFYTSQWIKDIEYKKQLSLKINHVISSKICAILKNYKTIYGYFMVKKQQDKTFSHLHQDWSIVDENKFIGLNTWIPLVDVDVQNGTMKVIKNSHHNYNKSRGINNYFNPEEFEGNQLVNIKMNKGDLLIFDQRLVHATYDNISKLDRVAAGSVYIPIEAKVMHYYKEHEDDNIINKLELDDDFLIKYSFGDDINKYFDNEI